MSESPLNGRQRSTYASCGTLACRWTRQTRPCFPARFLRSCSKKSSLPDRGDRGLL